MRTTARKVVGNDRRARPSPRTSAAPTEKARNPPPIGTSPTQASAPGHPLQTKSPRVAATSRADGGASRSSEGLAHHSSTAAQRVSDDEPLRTAELITSSSLAPTCRSPKAPTSCDDRGVTARTPLRGRKLSPPSSSRAGVVSEVISAVPKDTRESGWRPDSSKPSRSTTTGPPAFDNASSLAPSLGASVDFEAARRSRSPARFDPGSASAFVDKAEIESNRPPSPLMERRPLVSVGSTVTRPGPAAPRVVPPAGTIVQRKCRQGSEISGIVGRIRRSRISAGGRDSAYSRIRSARRSPCSGPSGIRNRCPSERTSRGRTPCLARLSSVPGGIAKEISRGGDARNRRLNSWEA